MSAALLALFSARLLLAILLFSRSGLRRIANIFSTTPAIPLSTLSRNDLLEEAELAAAGAVAGCMGGTVISGCIRLAKSLGQLYSALTC